MNKKYISHNESKQFKKSSERTNTEPNYTPYNIEYSNHNNHLSTQGTTGEIKYIQTEKSKSPKLIHKERHKQKSKKTNENKLYDLTCTLNLNLKIIEDLIKSGQIPKLNTRQIKQLQNKISIISKLINDHQLYKKEKESINLKKLMNSQILLETKLRKEENLNIQKESYDQKIELSKKKEITIRKCHKKFSEIQIYIRRESQNFSKYKRIYGNFSMDNFILENENMLRYKNKLKNNLTETNASISLLLKELNEFKKRKNKSYDKYNKFNNIIIEKNDNGMYENIDGEKKLNNFILISEGILKDSENKNLQIKQIFNKLSYKCYKNYYNNVLKYYNLINNNISKSQINENIVSDIMQKNSFDNNETNMSNLYFDIMNIGNNKSFFKLEDFSTFD
jgi:hypothetical protein